MRHQMGSSVAQQFVLSIILASCALATVDKVQLDEAGNFIDPRGRFLLFRGFNSVEKNPPWFPAHMLNRTQLQMFRDWGLNMVRLGVMWSGVMPEKHAVNETYMSIIEEIIDACAQYDIYLLLDMHQDAVSSRYGTYDGFPLWFVDEVCQTPQSVAYPWPYKQPPFYWFENYLTYACMDCATKLYKNESGAWEYWAEFWTVVAQRFGHKPNVLGFELLNEPPPPNVYKSLFSLLPGIAGRKYLLPAYDYLVEQIRKVDTETLIFYEPVTYGVFFPKLVYPIGTGFDRVPGALKDPNSYRKSVLSYHYYCWPLETGNLTLNMSVGLQLLCDSTLIPSVFINSDSAVRETKGGRFLTEFGYCKPDGNPLSTNTIECDAVLKMADTTFQSWSYWDTHLLDEDGNPIEPQVKLFVRTYPQKTLGIPHDLHFDVHSGKFKYSFLYRGVQSSSSDVEVARIFVPRSIHYASGTAVVVNPGFVQHQWDGRHLVLTVPASFAERMTYITVYVTRTTNGNSTLV